jgi:hypothetical protein
MAGNRTLFFREMFSRRTTFNNRIHILGAYPMSTNQPPTELVLGDIRALVEVDGTIRLELLYEVGYRLERWVQINNTTTSAGWDDKGIILAAKILPRQIHFRAPGDV